MTIENYFILCTFIKILMLSCIKLFQQFIDNVSYSCSNFKFHRKEKTLNTKNTFYNYCYTIYRVLCRFTLL